MPFPKFAGYSSVFKIYRFQNLLAKNMQFSCEQEAYPSHFSHFSKYASIVQPRSQGVLTSYADHEAE